MLERTTDGGGVVEALAAAIGGAGAEHHLDRLMDLIGELVPHDLITVTRYSTTHRPEFVSHRHYSDAMIRKYLDIYYAYDPFYAYWRRERRPGVVPLRSLATDEVKRGQYIAEFLNQSVICDEVGVLVADGGDCCLGIFLDRSARSFTSADIACLESGFPVLAAVHALDVRSRQPKGPAAPPVAGRAPPSGGPAALPANLWPELSTRERELVALILAGHPSATLARRLGITVGTVKNHRRRIYAKLDITTERELFLQYFECLAPSA